MDWMKAYDHKLEGKTDEEKKAYLDEEMKKVAQVKDAILESIEEATETLK